MRFIVLGAAAGGGLPQWNCGCGNCNSARSGTGGLLPQSQSSLAVSMDGRDWAILNASPDIRQQLIVCPPLHPRGLRNTPIKSVLITNGDIDHLAGLLTLREGQAFDLFVTGAVARVIDANPIFNALRPHVRRQTIASDAPFPLLPGLEARLFAVPGKVPLYMERAGADPATLDDHTVGIELTDAAGERAFYIPGCREWTPDLVARLTGARLLFLDGTVFEDDELSRIGVATKTGRRMGHVPISGEDGSLARLAALRPTRKIFVHINNTNPVWREGAERTEVVRHGFEVAFDGMEVESGTGA